jgi:hypothetical protein
LNRFLEVDAITGEARLTPNQSQASFENSDAIKPIISNLAEILKNNEFFGNPAHPGTTDESYYINPQDIYLTNELIEYWERLMAK